MSSKIKIDKERCKGCVMCVSVCSREIIRMSRDFNKKGFQFAEVCDNNCTGCMQCADICPDAAIEIYTEAGTEKPAGKTARKEK